MKSCCDHGCARARLRGGLFAVFAVWVALSVTACAADNQFRFVILTDVHVGRKDVSNARRYAAMAQELTALTPKPAAVFSTGDLTDHGLEEEYDHYLEWILAPLQAAGIPHYALPGNHEIGGNTNHNTLALWQQKFGPLYQAVTIQNTRFILTCGVPEGVTGGYGVKGGPGKIPGIGQAGFIDAPQLAWIRAQLDAPESRRADLLLVFNHFPLWDDDFGGYHIQDVDYFGAPTGAGTSLREWVDTFGVDLYACGHRHYQAPPVRHPLPSGRHALHVLSESAIMGKAFRETVAKGKSRTRGVFGYAVYDVSGTTLRHHRKTLDIAGFDVLGPRNAFTYDAADGRLELVPEPDTPAVAEPDPAPRGAGEAEGE